MAVYHMAEAKVYVLFLFARMEFTVKRMVDFHVEGLEKKKKKRHEGKKNQKKNS